MSAPLIVLILKTAVVAVTILFLMSMAALASGRRSLHGKLNTVFFVLTVSAVLGLEVAVRLLWPEVSAEFFDPNGPYRRPLVTHLFFSVPAAAVLPVMMYSGRFRRGHTHRALAGVFVVLWVGTVVTGVGYLPSGPATPTAPLARKTGDDAEPVALAQQPPPDFDAAPRTDR